MPQVSFFHLRLIFNSMAKKKKDGIMNDADMGDEVFQALSESANNYIQGNGTIISQDDIDADLTQFVSTGSIITDTIISNRKEKGGFPIGRVSEVIGWESSGKSMLGIYACIDTQKQGGVPVYKDIEKSMSFAFAQRLGLNWKRASYQRKIVTIEQVIESIFKDIEAIVTNQLEKKSKNRQPITIIVDSLASCTSSDTMEAEIGARQYANVARILSQEYPKIIDALDDANVALIMLNQLREKPGVTYGDKWYAPGGNANKFYASLRLLIAKGAQIKKDKGKPSEATIGFNTTVVTYKNKVSMPKRKASFDIYFDRGIVEDLGFYNILKQVGRIVPKTKQLSNLIMSGGDLLEFKNAKWGEVVKEHNSYIIDAVKDALIIDLNSDSEEVREASDDRSPIDAELSNGVSMDSDE